MAHRLMKLAFNEAMMAFWGDDAKPAWTKVSGPAEAVLATLDRTGWRALCWDRWVNCGGDRSGPRSIVPRAVDHCVEMATESTLRVQVARGNGKPKLEAAIFLEPIAKLIGQPSRSNLSRSADRTWDTRAAAHLRSRVVRTQWSQTQKHRGGKVDPKCLRCEYAVGALVHRHC